MTKPLLTSSPSPWRPTYRGYCDRREFLRGYAVVATLALGNVVAMLCFAVFADIFKFFGVNAMGVFGALIALAFFTWIPLLLVAGFVYLPILMVRRMRNIRLISALACMLTVGLAVWTALPSPGMYEEKNPIIIIFALILNPLVILSTFSLVLPATKTPNTTPE